MAKYYEKYGFLIFVASFCGLYFSPVEKLVRGKWRIWALRYLAVIPVGTIPIFVLSQLKYLLLDDGRTLYKLFSANVISFTTMSTFVYFSFYNNRKTYEDLLEFADKSLPGDPFPEDRQVLMEKMTRSTNLWSYIFLPMGAIPSIGYSIVTYFNPNKDLGHPSGFPNNHESPEFEVLVTVDLVVAFYSFVSLAAYDSLTIVFFSLVEVQLIHLRRSLSRILQAVTTTESGNLVVNVQDEESRPVCMKTVVDEVDKNLRIWVEHHQEVLRYHQQLQRIYGVTLSVKNFFFVLVICLTCFLIATDNFGLKNVLITIAFCFNNFSMFYIIIKHSDAIADLGQSLFEDAFAQNWYLYPLRIQTAIRMIQMRCQRTIQIIALKNYPLSSRSFLKILSGGYSFLTFLLQMAKKDTYECEHD